jgi:hypothetical protein
MYAPLAGGLTGLGFAGKFFSGRGFVLSCFLLFYGKGKGIEGRKMTKTAFRVRKGRQKQ